LLTHSHGYANGKSSARHCLAPGLLIWLYAYDRANQVPPALYSSNWQVPWHIFLTKPFAQHRPHGVSGPITVGPPSTAGGHRPLCAARGQSRRQGHVRGLRARQRVFLARRLLSELKVAPSRRAQCCRDSSFSTNVGRSASLIFVYADDPNVAAIVCWVALRPLPPPLRLRMAIAV
jgi:hypothetical protein